MERAVQDFDDEFELVVDSQDIEAIADSVGVDLSAYGSLFVLADDGDIRQVWGSYRAVPWLHVDYEQVYPDGAVWL